MFQIIDVLFQPSNPVIVFELLLWQRIQCNADEKSNGENHKKKRKEKKGYQVWTVQCKAMLAGHAHPSSLMPHM